MAGAVTTLAKNTDLSKTSACNENRLAWLALALSPGLGPKRILDAMQELEAPSRIFTMLLTELEGLRFPAAAAQFIFDGKARAAAEAEMGLVTAQGAKMVSFGCPEYPERLKEIYDPPPVLLGGGGGGVVGGGPGGRGWGRGGGR